ncbi:12540_t:CDS:2 [Funneliformis mosseae]|uniref:12540_t:CDS:1 n=1 Tax=Funneliformis mosseae TaxID=27381 RepID=A0A9N8W207_FUNMO|nr:12540_t:CDS:2 [Funneliformis mosseae]
MADCSATKVASTKHATTKTTGPELSEERQTIHDNLTEWSLMYYNNINNNVDK